jgi:hypothetical protein
MQESGATAGEVGRETSETSTVTGIRASASFPLIFTRISMFEHFDELSKNFVFKIFTLVLSQNLHFNLVFLSIFRKL